jgi:hypothetical protein
VPPKCGSTHQKRSIPQPTIGPSRLFTVNASLPFDRTSTKSFERAPELSEETDRIAAEHELVAEQALEPFQPSTTTQLPPTTTQTIDFKSFDSLKQTDIGGDKTAILPAPVIELQRTSEKGFTAKSISFSNCNNAVCQLFKQKFGKNHSGGSRRLQCCFADHINDCDCRPL